MDCGHAADDREVVNRYVTRQRCVVGEVESESNLKIKRMKCVAMEGLIEEADEVIESMILGFKGNTEEKKFKYCLNFKLSFEICYKNVLRCSAGNPQMPPAC